MEKGCAACRGELPPLDGAVVEQRIADLGGGWQLVDGPRVAKEYAFPDFRQALAFVVRVGDLADAAGHHPDLHLRWGSVRVAWWTQAVHALTDTDFVLAARCDTVVGG